MADPAGNLNASTAKAVLGPLGLVRKGRSRTWVDDHGWWLINVEFQPSQRGQGCYLNVGEQHLWVPRDHLCFEDHERPLGGATFVSLAGDDAAHAVDRVVRVAAEAVVRRRSMHRDGMEALARLVGVADDLNAGIAAALLGDRRTALRRLSGNVHPSETASAQRYLNLEGPEACARAVDDVRQARQLLRLPGLGAVSFW